jgi:sarcosine oxidase
MRIAVIGRGLVGAAAARHLARAGHDVVLIGPGEPVRIADHPGVFASHYDEGRITRSLDPDPFWSAVSRASIARYGEIEAQGGIAFYTERGVVMAGPEGSQAMERIGAVAARDGTDCDRLDDAGLATRFPDFRFEPGTMAWHEPRRAGFVSPRRLVAAQTRAAERAGAQVIAAEVRALDEHGRGVTIRHEAGRIEADRALVAAGAYSAALTGGAVPLAVMARTVAFFEVSGAEAARLGALPPLIYLHADGDGPYLLPPIRYPDGRWYLKMGGDRVDRTLGSPEEIGDWFRSGGDPEVARDLGHQVRARMPMLRIEATHHAACVTSFTPEDRARIAMISARIGVATGGCGRGAKCSDELGRLGAGTVLGTALSAAVAAD